MKHQNYPKSTGLLRSLLIKKGIQVQELAYYSRVPPEVIKQACLKNIISAKNRKLMIHTLRKHYGVANAESYIARYC